MKEREESETKGGMSRIERQAAERNRGFPQAERVLPFFPGRLPRESSCKPLSGSQGGWTTKDSIAVPSGSNRKSIFKS